MSLEKNKLRWWAFEIVHRSEGGVVRERLLFTLSLLITWAFRPFTVGSACKAEYCGLNF